MEKLTKHIKELYNHKFFFETDYSPEVYYLIYGEDVDIIELKKIKNRYEVHNDIILYLSNNDITKINEIKNMNAYQIFDILNSKIKKIPLKNNKIEIKGFKNNI